MKKYNILFVVFDRIDPFAGGVQSIVSILTNIFESQGHSVKFLLLNNDAENHDGIEYFTIQESEVNGIDLNLRLLNFLQMHQFDFVINNHGINFYNFFKKLIHYNQHLDAKFKLINYHHNAVRDIFKNYENISRNKFVNINSSLNKLIFYIFNRSFIFRQVYLVLGKIKLWYSFKRALDYSDANVFYFESFMFEAQNLFHATKVPLFDHILPPIKYDFEQSIFHQKENIILYVGRIELMQKRFDKLLNIWKDIHLAIPEWKLIIVGDGDYIHSAKSFVSMNQMLNIEFVGKADPLDYYKKSKLFVMTSDFEGLGLVLVESLTQGCVPIAFDCYSGINDVICHNINGLIITKGDDNLYKESILKLVNDNQKYSLLQKNNNYFEQKFSRDNIINGWNDLFAKLMNE